MALERFPGSEGSYNVNWTINTIDISIYDNGSSHTNYYSNSYIKKYLEEVVKVKMGVTSVSLPKWKGKERMYNSEIGSYDKSALKYKKITDYVETVRLTYKTLRSIKIGFGEGSRYPQHSWLGTGKSDESDCVYHINPEAKIYDAYTHRAFGIRPAIEY